MSEKEKELNGLINDFIKQCGDFARENELPFMIITKGRHVIAGSPSDTIPMLCNAIKSIDEAMIGVERPIEKILKRWSEGISESSPASLGKEN